VADTVGQRRDLRPHTARDLADRGARHRQLLEEHAGVDRGVRGVVVVEPIERRLSKPRRIEHEGAAGRRCDGQPAGSPDAADPTIGERIVAAGVDDEYPHRGAALGDPRHQVGKVDRFRDQKILGSLGGQRHIARQQQVASGDLDAVPRVVDESRVPRLQRAPERRDGKAEVAPAGAKRRSVSASSMP
jgi:hypothetical protein